KLRSVVRGELDWIVLKCLEKDRRRRYDTANGLAHDIERYLRDEPVQACAPSAWYRWRKFARRNRLGLAVVGLIVLVLVLLGGGWVVRDRAARQAKQASDRQLALERAELFQEQGQRAKALAGFEHAQLLIGEAAPDPVLQRRLEALKERLEAEAQDQDFIAQF